MGGCGVEVPPILLGVLAVVAFRPAEAEHPLLEDRVLAVPQRQRQAPGLPVVAEPGHAVLVPAVGPRPGVVVREVVPRPAILAVILADRPPCPFAEIRSPPPPGGTGVSKTPAFPSGTRC